MIQKKLLPSVRRSSFKAVNLPGESPGSEISGKIMKFILHAPERS